MEIDITRYIAAAVSFKARGRRSEIIGDKGAGSIRAFNVSRGEI